jgi:hypothetical protein
MTTLVVLAVLTIWTALGLLVAVGVGRSARERDYRL